MTECIRRDRSYWSACPCDTCNRDNRRKMKHRAAGIPWRIPHESAWEVLVEKFEAGWTAAAVASAAALPDHYFSRHQARWRRGETVLIGPALAETLLHKMGRPTSGQVGAEPSRRRLRALATIGWGLDTLADETGIRSTTLAMIRNCNKRVAASTANTIADTYDRLHMTPGADKQAIREARSKRWPGPLAWTDIDTDESPEGMNFCNSKGCTSAAFATGLCRQHYRISRGGNTEPNPIDPVTVNRILSGEWNLASSSTERTEVCRRWIAGGGSLAELERRTGWRTHRYYRVGEAA